MIREHPETKRYYYDVAQTYMSCSTTLVPSASGSVDRRAFAESCGGLALGMLVEAEKAGYFRSAEAVERLKIRHRLDPLRSRDGFRQLLARVWQQSRAEAIVSTRRSTVQARRSRAERQYFRSSTSRSSSASSSREGSPIVIATSSISNSANLACERCRALRT